ncbi:S8 family serine peptidase [Microbacterium profundi]|nr:S8 family serine peptidase [Microbacterium profundi]
MGGWASKTAAATGPVILALSLSLVGAATGPTPSPTPPAPRDPVRSAEFWLDTASIREAWQISRGAGQTIAVIDTGIGRGPTVFNGVTGGADFSGVGSSDGRTPVGVIDREHGSLVASVAAGRPSPGDTGMIGVAPEANLLSVSLGFPGSSSTVPFVQQMADGIRWAVDNGADVINLSFTTNTRDWHASWDDAFLYAYDHDVVVVTAAGNRGSGTDVVGAPATIPGVLAVAGVDKDGIASEEASTQGITIGVSAPSEDLIGVTSDGSVVEWNGTSAAAPIVAGVAALVRAAHPELDAGEVINRILQTADPVGAGNAPDPIYGHGIINAYEAVAADVPVASTNPADQLREWVRLYRRAEAEVVPDPEVTPVEIPPLPPPDSAAEASPLLPSRDTLLHGTIPLIALTVPSIMIGLGISAAVRLNRRSRVERAATARGD